MPGAIRLRQFAQSQMSDPQGPLGQNNVEWAVLKSGLVKGVGVGDIDERRSNYIDKFPAEDRLQAQ